MGLKLVKVNHIQSLGFCSFYSLWQGASLVAQSVKSMPAVQETGVWSPGEGNGDPLQYPCLEKSHGQRSLGGCSPWGCKKLGMTEWLSLPSFLTLLTLLCGFPLGSLLVERMLLGLWDVERKWKGDVPGHPGVRNPPHSAVDWSGNTDPTCI